MTTTGCALPPTPLPPRQPGRRGRPYRAEVVEAVRALLGTELRFDEIAARTGVGAATVGRWSRRFRAAAGEGLPPGRPGTCGPGGRHSPETRQAARAMVEGTQLGLERIALALGIGVATLARWVRSERWPRPAGGSHFKPARYRIPRGRPYAADAVGTVRDIVTATLLSQKRIAAQAGVSPPTVSSWIRKRGWTRPSPRPGSRRFAAASRAAPLAETGSRRGRPYAPETVTTARRLYEQTELPTLLIAARVRVSPVTVAKWAKQGGWTRPRDIPFPDGRPGRRRPRRKPPPFLPIA